jgi:tetratricopeptide (TPR) repeat protein
MTFASLVADAVQALRVAAYDEAASLLQRADEAASDDAEHALAAIHQASIGVLRNRKDADLNVFRENLVRRFSVKHVQLAAYYLVIAAVDRNDRDAADRYLPILLEAARQLGDPAVTLMSYEVAAGVESIRGNHTAAIEYGRVALSELASYQGDDLALTRAGIAHNLAYHCLAASEYADAVPYIEQALPAAEESGNPAVLRQCLITGAFAYLCRDRLDDAETLALRAAPLAAGDRLERYVHYLQGEIARRRGNHRAAAEHFRRLEAFYPDIPGVAEMLLSMNVAPFLLPE